MTGLEETFGEDFVQDYKQTVAEKRQERNKLQDEAALHIADKAVNQNEFHGGEPHFQYTTESGVTHDVLLMQLPDPDSKAIWSYVNELDSGAITLPLDYLGEWMSCLFNEPDDAKKMEPGEYAIIVGELDTWENDKGEVNEQVSPVRGVLTMKEANELADKALDDSGINEESSDEDESSDTEEEDDSEDGEDVPSFATGEEDDGDDEDEDDDDDDEDDGGSFLGDDDEEEEEDDEPPVNDSEVRTHVESLAENEEEVWELEAGDKRLKKLVKVICKRCELEDPSEEDAEYVAEVALDRIEEGPEEEEEEDDEEDALF